MLAKFLIRFDDICHTMNWVVWAEIEQILQKHKIKPMVAIVPDNKDRGLIYSDARPDFWERARCWRDELGWTIGLHGCTHELIATKKGLIPLNDYGEFTGLSPDAQKMKISAAMKTFKNEGLLPTVWVAPAHSFDEHTLRALDQRALTL